jgi:hypothetical protein
MSNRIPMFCWFAPIMLILAATCSGPESKKTVTPPSGTPRAIRPTTTPISSPTGLPTMSVESQLQFYALLENNRGCELPCVLGITPGETSWKEAAPFLADLARNKPLTPNPFSISDVFDEYIAEIYTGHEVLLDGNIQADVDGGNTIQHMTMFFEIKSGKFTETHDRHLAWYSLSDVMHRNGQPDDVYIYTTNQSLSYSIDIVYASRRFVVQYTGKAKLNDDSSYTLCPNLGDGDVSYVKIAVAGTRDPADVKTLIGFPFWEGSKLLDESTEITATDFYQLMTGDAQPACFMLHPSS